MFHCLPEVTHRKRHNRLKSKKLKETERARGGWPPLFHCLPEVTHTHKKAQQAEV